MSNRHVSQLCIGFQFQSYRKCVVFLWRTARNGLFRSLQSRFWFLKRMESRSRSLISKKNFDEIKRLWQIGQPLYVRSRYLSLARKDFVKHREKYEKLINGSEIDLTVPPKDPDKTEPNNFSPIQLRVSS